MQPEPSSSPPTGLLCEVPGCDFRAKDGTGASAHRRGGIHGTAEFRADEQRRRSRERAKDSTRQRRSRSTRSREQQDRINERQRERRRQRAEPASTDNGAASTPKAIRAAIRNERRWAELVAEVFPQGITFTDVDDLLAKLRFVEEMKTYAR